MTILNQISVPASNPALPLFTRDPLLRTDLAGGVRFDFDLAFPWCFSSASPVPAGTPVKDIAERADGRFVIASGDTLGVTGGGVDFSTLTKLGNYLEIPSSVAAAIYANGQKFMVCLYLRLPTQADWNSQASLLPFLSWGTSNNGYVNGPELVSLSQVNQGGTQKQIRFARQTATNVVDQAGLIVPTPDFGQVAQLAFWRSATEQRSRLRTANGITLSTSLAVGSDNANDFSALKGYAGLTPAFWGSSGAIPSDYRATAKNFRLYRGFIEALALSGRDPVAVLDADWARVAARGAFS